jgi:hypothetical protein
MVHTDDTEDCIIFLLFLAFLVVSVFNVQLQRSIDRACRIVEGTSGDGAEAEAGALLRERLLREAAASSAEGPDTGRRIVPGTVEENGRIEHLGTARLSYTAADYAEGM